MSKIKLPVASSFLLGLTNHNVEASVVDFDHYRLHGGILVETDYIISVNPKKPIDGAFESFKISKTYSAFRSLGTKLAEVTEKEADFKSKDSMTMLQFAQSVDHLIETQKANYLGKVNYNYVKSLAKRRAQVLNDTLETIYQNFPRPVEARTSSVRAVSQILDNFFLTDHIAENDGDSCGNGASEIEVGKIEAVGELSLLRRFSNGVKQGIKNRLQNTDSYSVEGKSTTAQTSPVVPISRKMRRSLSIRTKDEQQLLEIGKRANLLMDDDSTPVKLVPNYSRPVPTVHFGEGNQLGNMIENSPFAFLGIFLTSACALKLVSFLSIMIDFDIALLVAFAFFCVGLHMPRPSQDGIDTPAVTPKPFVSFRFPLRRGVQDSATTTIRRSLFVSDRVSKETASAFSASEHLQGEEDLLIKSPLPIFPKGANFGSHCNCWSMPNYEQFQVRGKNYLVDRVKIPSNNFFFTARGMDLFLTDTCPENVGTNSGILGGKLREKPTFVVNFRLPWGVVINYFEIPEKFIPFIQKRYEFDFDEQLPEIQKMSPAERCLARFLAADQEDKNKILKIVPFVAEGPWIVKSVVGGKPAIIGNKLPVNYIYEKASKGKSMYLEADLDIVSNSAARGILSVARSNTNVLTLDLGFVVQGNKEDELPEQMLCAMRMHGLDILGASPLPPMKNQFMLESMDEECSSVGFDH